MTSGQPTPEEIRRFPEQSLVGQREKLVADFRALVGERAFNALVAVSDAAALAGYVVRHPVAVGRTIWTLARSPELRAHVAERSGR